MKTIKKYKDFNEGLISKGLEILNYKIVKENDKIAKKYLDMVYEDYSKKGNLLAIKICQHKGYNQLWYRITEDPYGKPGEGGGNFPEYIEIEIMSIKEQLIK